MKKVYFADFETTQPNKDNKVFVYLWCILSGNEVYTGKTLETFINKLETLNGVVYFHNLKFDFSYIHYYLIKNNIEYKLLEKKGTIYQVKLFDIQLRDSMNFLPMSLKEVGENYCTKYQKTSIDYNVQEGHDATEEEITYCINDCRVVEEGLTNYLNTLEEILNSVNCVKSVKKLHKKLTNAGIAFEAFKELSMFEQLCPKTSKQQYDAWKGSYRGGFVYSNPKGIVTNVKMIDCNSMYPHIYSTIEMPYGNAFKFNDWEKLERYKFYIVNIFIKYELKPGYIPIIGGGVSKYGGINYKSSSNGEFEELTLCNIDLELIKRFYNCEIILRSGWGFDTKKEFFKEYAETFIKVKNANKGIKRSVAKVMLNSPYGKTAMNGLGEIKKYDIDEKHHIVKGEVIGYEVNDDVFQYLPIAIQITAGARKLLLETAETIGFENVYYMDTDSIKFKDVPTDIKCDPDKLGAWKDEGYCELFKTIAPKKYVYYSEGKIKFTCAGFNKKVLSEELEHGKEVSYKKAKELMQMFSPGLELDCLQSKVVEGGRALIPVKKQIK